jgi:DNA primase
MSAPPISQISDVEYYFYINNVKLPEYESVVKYLKQRGFTDQTIDRYRVGVGTESFLSEMGTTVDVKVVYFPMFQPSRK